MYKCKGCLIFRHYLKSTCTMFDREEKEAFVSGLTGTSIWEIYGVIGTSSLGLIVRHIGILGSKKIANLHNQSVM